MTAELDVIPFHNTEILTTKIHDKPFVVLKPVFEAIGLDADQQIRKIQRQNWATTSVTTVVAADGKMRSMIACDVRTFLMALATIPTSRVKVEARDLLEAYQAEVADVIEAYYANGMAPINPRVSPDQVPAVVDEAVSRYRSAREQQIAEDAMERTACARVSVEQARLLDFMMSSGLVDENWARTKAQVLLARGIGEVAAIPAQELPVYVEDFMKSKGVPRSKIGRFSGAFGKKVLAQAELDGVRIPGKRIQETTDGQVREITAWTKEHLPLFETAWKNSYAKDPRLKA